jgi:hypothetical protein
MSATGTTTFSTSGRKVAANSFPQLPNGKYTGVLRSSKAELRAPQDSPGKPARVSGVFIEVQHEGKALRVYTDFYTSLLPGKDGVVMPDRGGQIVQLAGMLDSALEAETLSATYTDKTGEVSTEYIDPDSVKQYLINNDGAEVRIQVKGEKDQKGELRAKVQNFLPMNEE